MVAARRTPKLTTMANRQQTPIERAKDHAEQWQAAYDEHMLRPSFLHLQPMELIALAENMKALSIEELQALDEAWFEMFGELVALPELVPAGGKATATGAVPAIEPEPEAELKDDDPVSGWKAA